MKKGKNSKMIPPYEKEGPLTREEVQCPICWSILMEPVTLPCKHSICLQCYRAHLQENLCCPCCRERISSWSRKIEKSNKLVNEIFWEKIKQEFPKFIEARLEGVDTQDVLASINMDCDNDSNVADDSVDLFGLRGTPPKPIDGQLVTNGGRLVQEEYESIHKQHLADLENEKKREEQASEEFIKKTIQNEEHLAHTLVSQSSLLTENSNNSAGKNDVLKFQPHLGQSRKLARNLLSEWGEESTLSSSSSSSSINQSDSSKHEGKILLNKNEQVKKTTTSESINEESFNFLNPTNTSSSSSSLTTTANFSTIVSSASTTTAPAIYQYNCSSTNSLMKPTTSRTQTNSSISSSSFVLVHAPQTTKCSSSDSGYDEQKPTITKTISFNPIPAAFPKSSNTPDSINVELNSHFRPIRTAPKTPPKAGHPEPRIVKSKPIRPRSISTDDETSTEKSPPVNSSTFGLTTIKTHVDGPVQIVQPVPVSTSSTSLTYQRDEIDSTLGMLKCHSTNESKVNEENLDQEQDEHQQDSQLVCLPISSAISNEISEPQPSSSAIKTMVIEDEAPPGQNSDCENQEQEEGENAGSSKISTEEDDTEKAEREYYLLQAIQLEQFRRKKIQEDEDRKLAELIHKSLNSTANQLPVRTRDSSNRYAIRNWVSKSNNTTSTDTSSTTQQETSTNSNIALPPPSIDSLTRTRRKRGRPSSSSSTKSTSNNNGQPSTSSDTTNATTSGKRGRRHTTKQKPTHTPSMEPAQPLRRTSRTRGRPKRLLE